MSIEYDNIGAVIASDAKRYLVNNELCTPEEADVLCLVYQDQPNEITNMSWWDVLGLAMKQNNYLFSWWEERAQHINPETPHPNKRRVVAALLPAPAGFNNMTDPTKWIETLNTLTRIHAHGNG